MQLLNKEEVDYHANYCLSADVRKKEENQLMAKDMNQFMLKSVTGILTLVEAQ